MKKNGKKYLAALLIITMTLLILPEMKGKEQSSVQAAAVTEIADSKALQEIVEECNAAGDAVEAKLTADISGITSEIKLTGGEFTLDLNGHLISAGTNSKGSVFVSSGSSILNLKDTSKEQTGGIINTTVSGGIISTTGKALNISGGTYTGSAYCIRVSGSEANFTGGNFIASHATDGITLHILKESKVNISGNPAFTSNYATVFVPLESKESQVSIAGGTFTANENGSFSFTCYIDGQCHLDITGGTFILNAKYGKSLFIGSNLADEDISIAGGTYQGRIARTNAKNPNLDASLFYGDDNGNKGILAEGCVLTNNTFSTEPLNILFTEQEVSVVEGSLIQLNTLRSVIEESKEADVEAAESADIDFLDSVSVGKDGQIYTNTTGGTVPALDTDRITDGNQYEFLGWYDTDGKAFASVEEYVKKAGDNLTDTTLYAGWKAKVASAEGFERAVAKAKAVRNLEVTKDISLTSSVQVSSVELAGERVLDFGNHRVLADSLISDSEEAALTLGGNWKIANGTIETTKQACLFLDGEAVLENVNCKSESSKYVVGFSDWGEKPVGRIISGTFETALEDGHALFLSGGNHPAAAERLTALFDGAYASSTDTVTDGVDIYLASPKLLVSKTPITYAENGADVDLGSYTRGDKLPSVSMALNHQEYMGDIVIHSISVDEPAFIVTGETTEKCLTGGSADTYSYTIAAAENNQPGTYQGTVSIRYSKMDGTTGIYKQKVSMTVVPKQLAITEPTLTKEKIYDGTTAVQMTAGTVSGVVSGDEVFVAAEAKYDSADAGTAKTISVKYTLTGADSKYYATPADGSYSDGKINKAAGTGSVNMADYHLGEKAPAPTLVSGTNGTASVTCYYKKKGAADSSYSTKTPSEEGKYILKAVFAETKNYSAVSATTEFQISCIATPKQPYTLSGTKGNSGWYKSKVVIKPAKGYRISSKQLGTYGSTYTVSSSGKPVIYLKNTNGAVTKAIQVEAIQIDSSAPKITGISNGTTYYNDSLKAVVSDTNLKSVTVNGAKVSIKGKSVTVSLPPTGEQTVIEVKDKAGNTRKYTVTVEEAWVKQGIISDGTKNLKGKKSYRLGSGNWKVSGDTTIYRGGKNIYVPDNGEYDFKKQ